MIVFINILIINIRGHSKKVNTDDFSAEFNNVIKQPKNIIKYRHLLVFTS